MASSGNNQIIVKGVPSHLSSDKLTIYFQKRRGVGGGDVQSVIFPKSRHEPGIAIVTFEDPETVQTVLKYEHKIAGEDVVVKENSYKKIFENTRTTISSFVIEEIAKKYTNAEDKIADVLDGIGATVTQSDGNYEITGDWIQVQAAFDRIVDIVGGEEDQGEPGYLEPVHPSNPTPTGSTSTPQSSVPNVCSVLLDKDIFAYIELVHQEELNKIGEQYDVTLDIQQIGDAIKVSASSSSRPAIAEKAIKRLKIFYDEISKSAHQDHVRLDIRVTGYKEIADDVISKLQPEFPRVVVSKMHDDEDAVIFIAPTDKECAMAKDQFNYFFDQAITTAEKGGAATKSGDILQVDRDVFGYLTLVHSDKVQAIWDAHGVVIQTQPIDECMELHLKPKDARGVFRLEEAKAAFKQLYGRVDDNIIVEEYDTSRAGVDEKTLERRIEYIRDLLKGLYIEKAHGREAVIFLSEKKDLCELGLESFVTGLERHTNKL